jgi:uncharacterized protein YchJ
MILPEEHIPEGQKQHFIPVVRDLTYWEKNESRIRPYSLCGCGSGKKFKFCCYKPRD